MSDKDKFCTHLADFLAVEREIIRRHIDKHKWFNGIEDEENAIHDFVKKYAWLMREVYCGGACANRKFCEIAKKFMPEEDVDGEE